MQIVRLLSESAEPVQAHEQDGHLYTHNWQPLYVHHEVDEFRVMSEVDICDLSPVNVSHVQLAPVLNRYLYPEPIFVAQFKDGTYVSLTTERYQRFCDELFAKANRMAAQRIATYDAPRDEEDESDMEVEGDSEDEDEGEDEECSSEDWVVEE